MVPINKKAPLLKRNFEKLLDLRSICSLLKKSYNSIDNKPITGIIMSNILGFILSPLVTCLL
jgi:hypothetical protein